MNDAIITRELLEIYDMCHQDLGLLDEHWASEKDRNRVTPEQALLLAEYVSKLHQVELDGFSHEMQENARERIRKIEEVTDPGVIGILRERISKG